MDALFCVVHETVIDDEHTLGDPYAERDATADQCPECAKRRPQTDAGKRLLDCIMSGFDDDLDPAALVVEVERAAEAWGKFRGVEMATRLAE